MGFACYSDGLGKDIWKMDFGAFWHKPPSQTLLTWMEQTQVYLQKSYDEMREKQDPKELEH
jgi:hypothetical protein